jgi:hypothetical protein
MTTAEKFEAALIAFGAAATWLAAPLLPVRLEFGALLLVVCVLLLLQGLLRDIWLLAVRRRAAAAEPAKAMACICVESAVGAAGVAAGLVVLGAGLGRPVVMTAAGWALCVAMTATAGFVLKDFVVGWSPWSIRREPDHLNIVVRWRRGS